MGQHPPVFSDDIGFGLLPPNQVSVELEHITSDNREHAEEHVSAETGHEDGVVELNSSVEKNTERNIDADRDTSGEERADIGSKNNSDEVVEDLSEGEPDASIDDLESGHEDTGDDKTSEFPCSDDERDNRCSEDIESRHLIGQRRKREDEESSLSGEADLKKKRIDLPVVVKRASASLSLVFMLQLRNCP